MLIIFPLIILGNRLEVARFRGDYLFQKFVFLYYFCSVIRKNEKFLKKY